MKFSASLKCYPKIRKYVGEFAPADIRSESPFRPSGGEREGPAQREGEVGGAVYRQVGPPHPAPSPGRRGERVSGRRLAQKFILACSPKHRAPGKPYGQWRERVNLKNP